LRSTPALIAGLSLGAAWFVISFILFAVFRIWMITVYPLILVLAFFVFSAIYVQTAATKERSHLFHLATRDGLTGLYVIRHFRLIMNQIIREASARNESIAVILMDIDHFKVINDTYGHPAGDTALKQVAKTIVAYIRQRRPFRQIDFASRYGGEEFIVVLRRAGLIEAQRVAERIRQKVENLKLNWEGKPIPVTISAGVSEKRSGENVPDPMVHRADGALYRAKRVGRNVVCTEKQ